MARQCEEYVPCERIAIRIEFLHSFARFPTTSKYGFMPGCAEVKFVAVNAAAKWAGKWALVTGASAGIGKAIAEQLGAAGANLIVTARRTERLADLASDLSSKHGAKVEVYQADLTHPGATRDIHAFTTGKGIEVELLINNAGFGAFGYMHD